MGEWCASFVTVNLSRRNVKRNVAFLVKMRSICTRQLAASEMSEINFRSGMKQAPSFNSCLNINATINAPSGRGYFIYVSSTYFSIVSQLPGPFYFAVSLASERKFIHEYSAKVETRYFRQNIRRYFKYTVEILVVITGIIISLLHYQYYYYPIMLLLLLLLLLLFYYSLLNCKCSCRFIHFVG